MLAIPNQVPGVLESVGITRAEAGREVWLVDRAGHKWAGAAAINRIWEELGGGWKWLAALYRLPPVRWLEDRVYRWVAANRSWLSRYWGAEPEWKE